MSAITTRTDPPIGYIHLLLHAPQYQCPMNVESEGEFFLEIPISFIEEHYRSPLKFLLYLGWCILGTHGQLLDHQLQKVPLDGQLQARGTYYYRPETTDNPFKYAVDVEAIQTKTESNTSDSTARYGDLPTDLLQRDGTCVFTGGNGAMSEMCIISHDKGDEWLKFIVANRPNDEPAVSMDSIADIRNGILCYANIHHYLDQKKAVILKTPNAILGMDDIVPRCRRSFKLLPNSSYPSDSRYTFQHFKIPYNEFERLTMPDNNDAAFLTSSTLPKPSALLLNYHYGAVAVSKWGQNASLFSMRPDIPRPKTPAMGPTRTPGLVNRRSSTKKRKLRESGEQEEAGPSCKAPKTEDSEQEWDEYDLILYFWANSKAARERREREQQDLKHYVEDWMSSVPPGTG